MGDLDRIQFSDSSEYDSIKSLLKEIPNAFDADRRCTRCKSKNHERQIMCSANCGKAYVNHLTMLDASSAMYAVQIAPCMDCGVSFNEIYRGSDTDEVERVIRDHNTPKTTGVPGGLGRIFV